MAKTKKVDPKAVAKTTLSAKIRTFLEEQGYEVSDGVDYGMTKGTLVVHDKDFDIQLKPIAPKTGVDRYEEI